ncbi:cobalamin biosynthesis protein CobW [Nocardioides sp. BGMRC 2183]|nr:cobalamin biosynthesis protein CobW [Nocardioides sp. BGMRC 2183]
MRIILNWKGSGPVVPVILISGVAERPLLSASVSLQLDLPDTVAVQHTIDPERHTLTRTVSDLQGVRERKVIDLAHACVPCAIREDIVPTLARLAEDGRWRGIVAALPIAAEPDQVCRVLAARPAVAPYLTVAASVTALDGATLRADLFGDDLLDERGLATSPEDRRGVAEVACSLVEYADTVCLTEEPTDAELAALRLLARPDVPVVTDASALDATRLVAGVHHHLRTETWVGAVRRGPLPLAATPGAWRLELVSPRPLHPIRFTDELAVIGGGPRRSRGCFWLPTRPDDICAWAAAGGQASVGTAGRWGRSERVTRIQMVGLDPLPGEPDPRPAIRAAFGRSLITDDEVAAKGLVWDEGWDGLEPWLGPIDRAA